MSTDDKDGAKQQGVAQQVADSSPNPNPKPPTPPPTTTPQAQPEKPAPASTATALKAPQSQPSETAAEPEFSLESPEVKTMARDTGVSPEAALAIHLGQTTLKRALQNAKKRQALYEFAQEHKLPHSLAGQVLKKQMSLDEAMTRSRVIEHRRIHEDHCSFRDAMQADAKMIFGLHNQQVVHAKVKNVLKYDIEMDVNGETSTIPKHNVKYLYSPEHKKIIRKMLKVDKDLGDKPRGPITKVAERFKIKDDQLQKVIDLKTHLNITLLEGEKLAAELKFYSKYEIVLGFKDDARLVVFRHALENAELVPLEEVLAAERYQKKMQKKSAGGGKGSKKKKKKRR